MLENIGCFRKACIKVLVEVEANPRASNQHEFNGVAELKTLFGRQRQTFLAVFSVQGEDCVCKANVTWYDSREAHPTRSEYRLYFQTNPVMARAQAGDSMIIGFDVAGALRCILIPSADAGPAYSSWTRISG